MWGAYTIANERHLLRGESRYTVARVYDNGSFKGEKQSYFEYWVGGKRYQMRQRVEWRGGWRPLGSWWYVRFAVPDPGMYEYLDISGPDAPRQVPADGWASLSAAMSEGVAASSQVVAVPPRPRPLSPRDSARRADSLARLRGYFAPNLRVPPARPRPAPDTANQLHF